MEAFFLEILRQDIEAKLTKLAPKEFQVVVIAKKAPNNQIEINKMVFCNVMLISFSF